MIGLQLAVFSVVDSRQWMVALLIYVVILLVRDVQQYQVVISMGDLRTIADCHGNLKKNDYYQVLSFFDSDDFHCHDSNFDD